jgi:hypothetical protein
MVQRLFAIALVTGTLLFSSVALAEHGGLVPCHGVDCGACDVVKLANNILRWVIEITASIVVLAIIYAGVKIVMSTTSTEARSQAKSMLTNAIIGFLIILGAWLIIDTVMKLIVDTGKIRPWNEIQCVAPPPTTTETEGDTTTTPPTTTPPTTPPVTGGACTPLSPITDPLAKRMEAGETVIWENTDSDLKPCVDKFIAKVGGHVTSAYRPQAYQNHFLEIKDRWCTNGLRSNTDAACSAVKAAVSAEVTKHFGAGWSCGAIGQTSRHTSGTGVDISGISHSSASVQAAAADSCLIWKNYSGDPYHYDLKSGCSCN